MKRFFAIFLIILIAGCTTPGGGSGVSLSMSVNPMSIKDTQKSLLTISAINNGDTDIEDAKLYIYGLGSEWGKQITVTPTITELKASNKDIGYVAKATKSSTFLTYTGELPKGQVFTFTPSARLCYPYKTIASADVDVYSESEFYRESPTQKSITVKQNAAPLQVRIDSKQPLISGEKILLDMVITNAGSGTVTSIGCDAVNTKLDYSKLNTISDMTIKINGDACKPNLGSRKYYLQKGDTAEFTLECDSALETSNPKDTKKITIELGYNYYIDAKTSISVEGTGDITRTNDDVDDTRDIITPEPSDTLVSTDFCTQLCSYAKNSYSYNVPMSGEENRYLGYCIDFDLNSIDYEEYVNLLIDKNQKISTGIVEKTNVGGKTLQVGVKEPGWGFLMFNNYPDKDSDTIKDLDLHDAQVGDFNILELTLGSIDNIKASEQYSNFGDSGFVGILDAFCARSTKGMSVTKKKTTTDLCVGNKATDELKKIQLKELLTINGIDLTNSDDFDKLNEMSIRTFKIEKIIKKSIIDMDIGIDDIDVGRFKIKFVLDSLPRDMSDFEKHKFLRLAKCRYGNTDYIRIDNDDGTGEETRCMCVTVATDLGLKTDIYEGTSSECTKACDELNDGGACLKKDTRGGTKECRGGGIYTYLAVNKNVKDCTSDSQCHCYDKETLSSIEKKLLCP